LLKVDKQENVVQFSIETEREQKKREKDVEIDFEEVKEGINGQVLMICLGRVMMNHNLTLSSGNC
jgi:hypothetical protein